MRLCLDTSAYSHFKRGDPQVVDLIDRADWLGVQFLANPAVEVLPVSDDMVEIYADIVLDLKKAGTPLPANDIWIATVAVRHGAIVLTYDGHFRSIARVGATVLTKPTV